MMADPLDFATQLARQAGNFLREVFQLSGTKASFKADHSFVTEADVAVDHMLTAAIRDLYPDDSILSEELQTSLSKPAKALWIIDPLDGTTNFALGLHVWGVLITRLMNGEPDLCALYFPLLDEMYTAQLGKGAWLNDQTIHTHPPDPSQPYGFFVCCSRTHRRYDVSIPYKPRILGSSAYTFCSLARGAALIGFESTPKIWDIAGAWLLVQEAGGVITALENQLPFPLLSGKDYSQHSYPTLAAATSDLLQTAQGQIIRKNRQKSKEEN